MSGVLNLLAGGALPFVLNAQVMNPFNTSVGPAHCTAQTSIAAADSNVTMTNRSAFLLVPYGTPLSALEIFVTGSGDTPAGSAINVWLSLGTVRTWSLTTASVQSLTFTGTYSVRVIATGQVLGGSTFTISAVES